MRTTLSLDDTLLAKVQNLMGFSGKTRLVGEALKALIERESVRHLAHLGGSEPMLLSTPRRQMESQCDSC